MSAMAVFNAMESTSGFDTLLQWSAGTYLVICHTGGTWMAVMVRHAWWVVHHVNRNRSIRGPAYMGLCYPYTGMVICI